MFVAILRSFCLSIDFVVKLAGYAASGLMPVLAFIVSFEVFSRYFLNRPTIWAFDLSLFLFGYIAILGGAYAQQKRAHITVDILYKNVSPKVKRVFDLISYAAAIFFLVLIIYVCFDKLQDALKFGTRRQSEWAPPMAHFWIMTIFASCLFSLQLGRDMVENVYYLATGKRLVARDDAKAVLEKLEKSDGN